MDEFVTDLLNQSPAISLLVLFLFGFYKEWWYIGGPVRERHVDHVASLAECEKRGDEWKARALSALKLSEDAAWIAQERGEKK